MDSHRHHPLRFQLRATLYTEYASNSKDHIDEPDSQAPEDWRQVIPNQFEGGAGIRKLLLVQNNYQVTPFEIVFMNFEFLLKMGRDPGG